MSTPASHSAMQAVEEMRARLDDADVRNVLLGEQFEPPCVVITLPQFTFNGPHPWPTDATFGIAAVVANDDRMVPNAIDLVYRVIRALDESTDEFAIADSAVPAQFPSGAQSLPAYLIQVEVALNDGQAHEA